MTRLKYIIFVLSIVTFISGCNDRGVDPISASRSASGAIEVESKNVWLSPPNALGQVTLSGGEKSLLVLESCDLNLSLNREGEPILDQQVTRDLQKDGSFKFPLYHLELDDEVVLTVSCPNARERLVMHAQLAGEAVHPHLVMGALEPDLKQGSLHVVLAKIRFEGIPDGDTGDIRLLGDTGAIVHAEDEDYSLQLSLMREGREWVGDAQREVRGYVEADGRFEIPLHGVRRGDVISLRLLTSQGSFVARLQAMITDKSEMPVMLTQ